MLLPFDQDGGVQAIFEECQCRRGAGELTQETSELALFVRHCRLSRRQGRSVDAAGNLPPALRRHVVAALRTKEMDAVQSCGQVLDLDTPRC